MPNQDKKIMRLQKAKEAAEQLLEEKSRELYQSNQELLDKNREYSLLLELSGLANKGRSEIDLLDFFVFHTQTTLAPAIGHVFMVEADELKSAKVWSVSDELYSDNVAEFIEETEGLKYRVNDGFPGRVYQARELVFDSNLFTDLTRPRSKVGNSLGFGMGLGIPLFRGDNIIAIAEFYMKNVPQSQDSIIQTLSSAAEQLQTLMDRLAAESALKQSHEELKAAQSKLVQSEKMASLGQLAAGVAHEINNPIAFVMSNVSTLGKYIKKFNQAIALYADASELPEDIQKQIKSMNLDFIIEDVEDIITESSDGLVRVQEIVKDLKLYARVDEAEEKNFQVNESINIALNMLANEIKYHCEVKTSLGDLPEVRGNPGQMNQVFTNLIVNASQAIEDKGLIEIETYVEGEEVVAIVGDNGSGIPDDIKENIFEPFFTTKAVGVGTGLGLSILQGIIEEHKGSISLESEVGVGTKFYIRLPIIK